MKEAEIKAKELVEKYQKQKVSILYYENSIPNIVHSEMVNKSAIQCAIICVDEIIKTESLLSSQDAECYDDLADTMLLDFWQEVLTHLKEM